MIQDSLVEQKQVVWFIVVEHFGTLAPLKVAEWATPAANVPADIQMW